MALAASTATRERRALGRGNSCNGDHSPCTGRRRHGSRPERSSVHDSRHRDSAHGGWGEACERWRLVRTDSCVWPAAWGSARGWPDRSVKTVPSHRTRRAFRIEILNLSTRIFLHASRTAGFLPTPPILTVTASRGYARIRLQASRAAAEQVGSVALPSGTL